MPSFKIPKWSVSHLSFTLIFTVLLFVVCNALNINSFARWFYVKGDMDYSSLMAFFIFGWGFFVAFFILFAHRWTIKPLAILFIILSAGASYFISKYGIEIETTMVMNVIYTDTTEFTGLLSIYMLPYVLFLVVLPILIISRVNITFSRPIKYLLTSTLLFVVSLAVGIGAVYMNYDSIHRAVNLSNKSIWHKLVPTNVIVGALGAVQDVVESNIKLNKTEVEITGYIEKQDDLIVVLAIGETSRQANFNLYGYDRRNTNPLLSKDKGLHILNGKASIGTTYLALRVILEKDDVKLPAITSKLGIKTACYVNYTLYDNCDAVGEVAVSECGHGGKCYDEDVIPLLEQNLNAYESGYNFIVLHFGGGSHGPSYVDRHPVEFQKFEPQCLEADVVNHCTKEQLYNSYDNTILYVDYVVSETIKRLDESKKPYVFIYLSDHGESLLEGGRIFHGMPPGISLPPEQAEIPLLIKSSIPISIEARDEYDQTAVFDSILDLFSIQTPTLNSDSVFIRRTSLDD
ncbi:MAG: lipid A ethanolaminephosphotransferase [Chitinophagales bacterium]|jgi:lipid A ethanolaminephosphotransferase